MRDGGIGRVLVAALHQGIADRLPSRLEFYESWLTPEGLRSGTIGLAPLVAVLSFLRSEGDSYRHVMSRAGEYAGQWTVEALSIACDLVRVAYAGSRARARVRRGTGEVMVRGSLFCGVREPSSEALCGFYAAAIARVLALFDIDGPVRVHACRGMGQRACLLSVALPQPGRATAPAKSAGQPSEGR
jgi:predicted hydrocarbon binding protein